MEKATFSAGCFRGFEAVFRRVPGIIETEVGYTGGTLRNPTYEDAYTDRTGRAEAVQASFDPYRVSHEQPIEIFWECHDPTQLNRQGPESARSRSAIFYHTAQQQAAALASKTTLAKSGRHSKRSSPRSFRPRPSIAPRNLTSATRRSTATHLAAEEINVRR